MAIKNKKIIEISNDECEVEYKKAHRGLNIIYSISNYMKSYYEEPSPDPSKKYYDICG